MKKHLKSVISFVIALALSLSSVAAMAATTYDDVPADAAYAEAVANLTAINVVEGYGDGKFNPDGKITRAEVATMIVRALAQDNAAKSSIGATDFTDVAADHWASGYINVASRGAAAFINGMGDGTFAPEANVTYAQVVKMLVAGIGYGDWGISNGGFPTGYIATAKQIGITDGVQSVAADEAVTRGVVAQLINNAIDTPLLALKVYSPTDPEYVIMDGTDGNDYETVLTYYHNIYKVEGRVIETNRTNPTIDSDKVRYQIEVTKNYDNSDVVLKKSDEAEYPEMMLIGDTNVADYLNVYSKLMVKVTDNEDPVILSCVASGKNTTVTLDADAWDDEKYDKDVALDYAFGVGEDNEDLGEDRGQLWYYANSSKSGKSSRYYLDDDYTLYVNGVEVDVTKANVETYIMDNTTGKVTFVDTPSIESNSTDGRYDAVFVSYYATAVVESLNSNGKVFFDAVTGVGSYKGANVEFDEDDDDLTFSLTLNGEDIAWTDLKEDDVLSIAYNVVEGFENSNFYEVLVSRDVVEGKVTETNTEDEELAIDGTTYSYIPEMVEVSESDDDKGMKLGSSYVAYLDAFGKVVNYEKLSTSVKYGIVSRAYTSTDADEDRVVIYDSTATKKTFVMADTFKYLNGATEDILADFGTTATDAEAMDRVVTYETNSKGEIKEVKVLNASGGADQNYTAKNDKIGSLKFDDTTIMISVDGKDFSVVSVSALADDNDYKAYGYDKEDGIYGIIVITDGVGSYTKDTRFAVVEKVTQGVNEDGDDCDKIALYSSDSDEIQTVCADGTDMFYGELSKGDVIIYTTNAAGVIEDEDDVVVIFSAGTAYIDYARTESIDDWADGLFSIPSGWTDPEDEVELYFGPIVDRSSKSITLGRVIEEGGNRVTYTEELKNDDLTVEYNPIDLDYASDVAVYVYDFNNAKDKRLSVGTAASVIKTNVAKSVKLEDIEGNNTIINWDDEETPEFTYALVKTVEDDVTDVFVIIPRD